jgi:D-glycero-alpha-D-manno-heptose 1-phosphate guanylyltransferase
VSGVDGPENAAVTQAVILAGGLGTRLRPLVHDRIKPMALVAGKPFLEYPIRQLIKFGLTDIILCVGHGAESVERYFGSGDRWGVRLRYAYEPTLRGTGGALTLASEFLTESTFLVMNGDSLFDIDLAALVRHHRHAEALATMALLELDSTERSGVTEIEPNGEVTAFHERGARGRRGLVNGGVYVLEAEVMTRIPDNRPVSLEREVFPDLVGCRFYGLPFSAWFVDIGIPEAYLSLCADPSHLVRATG